MKRDDVIEILKWSIAKRRNRIPADPLATLSLIETIKPGLEGKVIRNVKQEDFEHLKDGGMLIFAGDYGVGKTVAAVFYACLLPNVAVQEFGDEENRHVYPPDFYFCTASDLLANAYNRKDGLPIGMKPQRLIESKSILIIDEIGKESVKKGWTLQKLEDFFNRRYTLKLPTLCTTNIREQSEFNSHYGDWIKDRFRKWGRWIYTEGESLRGAN